MRIIKLEQSGFIFESESGFRLALDIGNKTPLASLDAIASPDALLISHIHGDHFSPPHIHKLAPTTLYLNSECLAAFTKESPSSTVSVETVARGTTGNIGPFEVSCFDVDHGPNITTPVENLGFLIRGDGKTVYFTGDMFYPSGLDTTALEVDTALIPVGTFYTFGPKEALDFVRTFKKIGTIIPMHYEKTPETLGQFLDLAGSEFQINQD